MPDFKWIIGLALSLLAWLSAWRVAAAKESGASGAHAKATDKAIAELQAAQGALATAVGAIGDVRALREEMKCTALALQTLSISLTEVKGQMKGVDDRNEDFRQDFHELKQQLQSGVSEVRALATTIAALQSSQDVVNAVNADAVKAVVAKLERNEERAEGNQGKINDLAGTLKLISELLQNSKLEKRN